MAATVGAIVNATPIIQPLTTTNNDTDECIHILQLGHQRWSCQAAR